MLLETELSQKCEKNSVGSSVVSEFFGNPLHRPLETTRRNPLDKIEIKPIDSKKERLLTRQLRSLYSNFDRCVSKNRSREIRRKSSKEFVHAKHQYDIFSGEHFSLAQSPPITKQNLKKYSLDFKTLTNTSIVENPLLRQLSMKDL